MASPARQEDINTLNNLVSGIFEDVASTCIEISGFQHKIENKADKVFKMSEAQIKKKTDKLWKLLFMMPRTPSIASSYLHFMVISSSGGIFWPSSTPG